MRIARLYIKNFRSIKELSLELGQINALVGSNNTGKSNILLALKQLLGQKWLTVNMIDEKDVYTRDPQKDIIIGIELEPPYALENYREFTEIQKLVMKYMQFQRKERREKGKRYNCCYRFRYFRYNINITITLFENLFDAISILLLKATKEKKMAYLIMLGRRED